jgi:hypothetical protein
MGQSIIPNNTQADILSFCRQCCEPEFIFKNAADRLAYPVKAEDVSKIAIQTDDRSKWILVDYSPVSWAHMDKDIYPGTVGAKMVAFPSYPNSLIIETSDGGTISIVENKEPMFFSPTSIKWTSQANSSQKHIIAAGLPINLVQKKFEFSLFEYKAKITGKAAIGFKIYDMTDKCIISKLCSNTNGAWETIKLDAGDIATLASGKWDFSIRKTFKIQIEFSAQDGGEALMSSIFYNYLPLPETLPQGGLPNVNQ